MAEAFNEAMRKETAMKHLAAFAVIFKREPTAKKSDGWERGIFVGRFAEDDNGIIIDMDGKVVSTVWDYHDQQHEGCFLVRED